MPRALSAIAFSVLLISTETVFANCTATGNETIDCSGTIYRAVDDECVHYVDLNAHNANHPGVALPVLDKTIADNYAADAIPDPVVVELTDYVDCTLTDHNFSDASMVSGSRANEPSRLMNISGKTFRVTASPDDGFDTMYYSYDVQLSGTAGTPHLLVAESSNDQERYTSLLIHHPDATLDGFANPFWSTYDWASPYAGEPTLEPWPGAWWQVNTTYTQQGPAFAPDVGVTIYTGREWPIDNQPFNTGLIFHAKSDVTRVVVSSLGANLNRSSTDGGAVSQMWVFAFVDDMNARMPALELPSEPSEQRRIGVHYTHPWYLYMHNGTPVRTLAQRQAGLQRIVRHFKYLGMNYIVFNAINGADRSEKAWYPGSSYFDWNAAGDLLTELPPIAQAEGMELVPLITSLQKTPGNGLSITSEAFQIGSDGNTVQAFGNATLDPLHPATQQIVFDLLDEIASRCASNSSVRGIGLRTNGMIGTCYTSQQDSTRGARHSGYSSWDVQQFNNDTGRSVPTSPPSTAYNWLTGHPADWEAWIDWRCSRTRDFWLACRDRIQTYRPDLIFYVQADLPSEMPGTNIEWPGESPKELLRHHGYDPDLFTNDTGIVIARGMMVARERFYHSGRWTAPWGADHDNYKAFHFAPGLAEMYETAEGRAVDMYQNYWEEAFNPYYEFGFTGQPTYFRTTTPAAFDRYFFEGATMSVRRQDPDTLTWLGWNRASLGHEQRMRKFAQAYRALPAADPVPFDGTIDPALPEVVARWHANRLAVINDTSVPRTITLNFAQPVPAGDELRNVVTGELLVSASQSERQNVSFEAEAFSLNTFLSSVEPQPIIALSETGIARTTGRYVNPTDDTFTVHNASSSAGTLNYTVSVDQPWLVVSPTSGDSTGPSDIDTITVSVDVGTMAVGTYAASITVSDPAAMNDPQMIAVDLEIIPIDIDADLDNDSDVDATDMLLFRNCLTGAGVGPIAPGCEPMDFNRDDDIDLDDLGMMQSCLSGNGIPADPFCRE